MSNTDVHSLRRGPLSPPVKSTSVAPRGSVALLRLVIARYAIQNIAPEVRRIGSHSPAQAAQPSIWQLTVNTLQILLAENVLLLPMDVSTWNLLDIWPLDTEGKPGRKVFSVSWQPQRPWIPPWIACFHRGEWIAKLPLHKSETPVQ